MSSPAAFDPFSVEYMADPYPLFARLRDEAPAFYAPDIDMWVVTRASDIDDIFRDPARFSAANAQDSVFPHSPQVRRILADGGFGAAPVMSNCDPPDHARIRVHNMQAFSVRRIGALEQPVRAKTTELVDRLLPRGEADLAAELSYPLPATMIFGLLGFPREDTEMLKSWTGDRLVFTWGRPTPDAQVAVAENMVRYWRYVSDFVRRQLDRPGDDFTGDLLRVHIADPKELSLSEVTNVVYGLSFAGHENLTSMTNNAIRQLLVHRDQWDALCADPSLIPMAIEEALRYDSSNPGWRRVASERVRIGDVDVPAGAKLLLLLGAANRDPARFADPETFDIRRGDARKHLAFGKGIHYCLGAALVRLEIHVVLEVLTRQMPSLRLTQGQTFDFTPNIAFRGPRRLLVEWDERGVAGC
jgi:cytochrome P450